MNESIVATHHHLLTAPQGQPSPSRRCQRQTCHLRRISPPPLPTRLQGRPAPEHTHREVKLGYRQHLIDLDWLVRLQFGLWHVPSCSLRSQPSPRAARPTSSGTPVMVCFVRTAAQNKRGSGRVRSDLLTRVMPERECSRTRSRLCSSETRSMRVAKRSGGGTPADFRRLDFLFGF